MLYRAVFTPWGRKSYPMAHFSPGLGHLRLGPIRLACFPDLKHTAPDLRDQLHPFVESSRVSTRWHELGTGSAPGSGTPRGRSKLRRRSIRTRQRYCWFCRSSLAVLRIAPSRHSLIAIWRPSAEHRRLTPPVPVTIAWLTVPAPPRPCGGAQRPSTARSPVSQPRLRGSRLGAGRNNLSRVPPGLPPAGDR